MGKPNHNKLKRSPIDINGQPEAHRIFVTKDYFVSLVTNSNLKKNNVCKQYTHSLLPDVWICQLVTNHTKLGNKC